MEPIQRILSINVSGRMFSVPEETLKVSGLFADMLEDGVVDDLITIYKSPMAFEEMLVYMYSPEYVYPARFDAEADYYLMPKIVRVPKKPVTGSKGERGCDGTQGRDGPQGDQKRVPYSALGSKGWCGRDNRSGCISGNTCR